MKLGPWLALALLAAPIASAATPVAYAHTGGQAVIELRLNGVVVASASAPLDGMSLSFDAATAQIADLDLVLDDSIRFPRRLNYDTLSFSLQAVDAAGFASSGTGANPYAVTSGPILVSFSGVISDGLNGPPPPNISFSGSLATGLVGSTVALAGSDISATFASTRMLQHGWQTLELLAAVTFEGTAVPEASAWLLLGSGAIGLAAFGRRRLS